MENQENRRKNSGGNQKRNNHDKNKPANDPNAKNKYNKNNQDSTNKTKGRYDNKPYQHPPHNATQKYNQRHGHPYQNAGVPGYSHQNQRQNYSGQNYGNPQMKYVRQLNPNNTGNLMVNMVTTQTSYQRQNYSGQNYGNPQMKYIRQQNPSGTGNQMVNMVTTQTTYQRQNYSGQNYENAGMISYTRQLNQKSGNQMAKMATTQTSYEMKNYHSQHVQTNQNYRNPQLTYNTRQQSLHNTHVVNGIATGFNKMTIQLGDLRPNPFNRAFNQAQGTLRNIRPNPFNPAFNQDQSLNTAMFNQADNRHSSNKEEVQTKDVVRVLRQWEGSGVGMTDPNPGFDFSVMSYNVLAQDLISQHPYLYRDHDQEFLRWDIRWRNLLTEIKDLDPDIMCLQEVQETHLKGYFSIFKSLGYEGIYKKRTGIRVDGCAIYYKKDKFTAVEHTAVEYRQPNVPLLDRDNVGLIVKFAPKVNSTKEFVVATTHLLYNQRREDVRLAQAQLLVTEVERISYKRNEKDPSNSYVPVIITGDFNALPDSSVIKFMLNKGVNYSELPPQILRQLLGHPVLVTSALGISDNCQHVDLLINRENNVTISRPEEQKLIKLHSTEVKKEQCTASQAVHCSTQPGQPLSSGTLSHKFKMKSAYFNQNGTTRQDDNWITVDYIFYSIPDNSYRDKLNCESRLGLLRNRQLKLVKIPGIDVGSDHFSLLAKFKFYY